MAQTEKPRVCIISCSVLKRELQKLKADGKLDAELVFISKNFHVDFTQLENNLRKVVEHTKKTFKGKIVLLYGDLCLGMAGEMMRIVDEYGVSKVDALNCIDCQLGGSGKSQTADPEHNLMFMGPGMIEFFKDMRYNLGQQGVNDAAFEAMFSSVKGAVILDTLNDSEGCVNAFKDLGLKLKVLEIRKVGSENVLRVVEDAIERASRIN
jgi:hypothetical protein